MSCTLNKPKQESATAAAARRRAATGISAVREGPGYLEVSVSSQAAAAAGMRCIAFHMICPRGAQPPVAFSRTHRFCRASNSSRGTVAA